MRRPSFSTVFHTLTGLALVACGGGDFSRNSDSRTALRVALLTPGPISDHSWNAGAYAGLEAIRDSLGARISHIQTKTPAEFEENFRQYARQGYRLVFGHGCEYQDAAKRVAPAFPRTFFVITCGGVSGPNLASMEFGFADASYLAGIVAGALTKTGRLGLIGGQELPPVRESFDAFTRGAARSRPGVQIVRAYIGNWDDLSAAREQALAQLARGAAVLFQNADAAGLGVFQAVRERPGTLIFGSNSNQNALAPDVTVGSVVINLPRAFLSVARDIEAGTFKPRIIDFGSRTRVVTLELNPALTSRIPATARARVDSLQHLMFDGRFSATSAADTTKR